ncbi:MAG: replicative DNA helicase [Lachnospiraceae bacterium]
MDEAFIKKIQPHSIEAEQSVIGSMIMDRDAIIVVSDMLVKEDFYQTQFGILYDAMVTLYNEGKPVDLITLQNKLKEKSVPENISSLDFIRDIVETVPTSANVKQYAEIVKGKSVLRRLIHTCEGITNDAYLAKEDVDDILEKTEKEVFQLLQQSSGSQDFTPIREVVLNSLDAIEEAAKNGGSVTGIPTGFTDLDYKLAGMHPSELILVAARPAMGKTAFVLNIAQHVAFRKQLPVAIFSLEMSKEQLVTRLLAMESLVDSQNIRTGNLQDMEWEKLMESVGVVGNSNLIIDDTPGITIAELRSKCRRYKQTQDIQLVIIDYLQLMAGGKRSESRQQEISEISRSLKALAREINCPVIALSQLSRAVESRPDHRPMLSDLRESGAIEQDADVVMFIYRDDYYNEDSEKKNIAEINVAKQRNGSTGTVELVWLGQYTKFTNKERA